eukprot:scaffold26597_cov160-Skeletonema_menzelii.AAC.3
MGAHWHRFQRKSRNRNTSRREIRASRPFTAMHEIIQQTTRQALVSTKPTSELRTALLSTKSGKKLKVPTDNIAADKRSGF